MISQTSQEFGEIRKVCEEAIDASRAALERHGVSQVDAEYERGRISAFRDIMGLGKPNPVALASQNQQPRSGDRSGIM